VAPAGTPRPVINRLHTELVKILQSPEVRERLVAEGAEVQTTTPEELAAFVRAEIRKWAAVVKASGAKVD
jgi:tripartite-type tricarboxylate transporter receptor subunit TctC